MNRRVFACAGALIIAAAVFARGAGKSDVADAAMRGDKPAVRALITQKADVNAPQVDGATALHWAVYREDLEMADVLLMTSVRTPFGTVTISSTGPETLMSSSAGIPTMRRSSFPWIATTGSPKHHNRSASVRAAKIPNARQTVTTKTAILEGSLTPRTPLSPYDPGVVTGTRPGPGITV